MLFSLCPNLDFLTYMCNNVIASFRCESEGTMKLKIEIKAFDGQTDEVDRYEVQVIG